MPKRRLCQCVVLLLLCMCVGLAQADLQDGLVSHWKLDEGAGNIAYDSMGVSDGQLKDIAN